MAVTIRDVAAAAGVSPSTVSRTLRGSSSISRKTQEKVLQVVHELGYEYTPATSDKPEEAQPLKILGIVFPPAISRTYENPFFLEIIRGITQFTNACHALAVTITGKDDQETIEAIKDLNNQDFSCSFITLFSRTDDPVVDFLYSEGMDYVQIGNSGMHSREIVSIDNDNISAGYDAARYLYQLGHRNIAFAEAQSNEIYSNSRRRGYQMFMNEHGLDTGAVISVDTEQKEVNLHSPLEQLLSLPKCDRPTAIIVADDIFALEIALSASRHKLKIPEDLSIISFNNSLFSRSFSPAITSIDVNPTQLGMEAANQALNRLDNPLLSPSRTLIPYKIIGRESCRSL